MTDYARFHELDYKYGAPSENFAVIEVKDWDNRTNRFLIPPRHFNKDDFEYFVLDAWQRETEHELVYEWTDENTMHVYPLDETYIDWTA